MESGKGVDGMAMMRGGTLVIPVDFHLLMVGDAEAERVGRRWFQKGKELCRLPVLCVCNHLGERLYRSSILYLHRSEDMKAGYREADAWWLHGGIFTVGFHLVGDNVYCFFVWFSYQPTGVVWMANLDVPTNEKYLELSLTDVGSSITQIPVYFHGKQNDTGLSTIEEQGSSAQLPWLLP
ncbi:hypothetical protein L6452_20321 [Arctium lappa]|uniref:Uncharacterized protein n=1 Tax=Arctium lappa TaxID=4217 RepID=A0ACB9BBV9_ARCLA|nr:hypothetical protein L6452_20321 [Arctium lappa]